MQLATQENEFEMILDSLFDILLNFHSVAWIHSFRYKTACGLSLRSFEMKFPCVRLNVI